MSQTIIALDVGHSAVKVVAETAFGRPALLFPSAVTAAMEISESSTRQSAARETVEVDGRLFFFGSTAAMQGSLDAESGLSESWVTAPQYTALVLGAFKKLRELPNPVAIDGSTIVVGLPSKLYAAQRGALALLMSRLAPTAKTYVLPQPLGPFMTIKLDENGRESVHHQIGQESWGVIEIGHFTTDLGVVKNGLWIEKHAGSCRGGHIVAESVARQIGATRGYSMSSLEATQAIVDGHFIEYGERVAVEPYVAAAQTGLLDEVLDTVSRLLEKDARSLTGIVVAGGGAALLYPALKLKFKHAVMAPDARMSVAEGFRRFGCAVRNAERSKAAQAARPAGASMAA